HESPLYFQDSDEAVDFALIADTWFVRFMRMLAVPRSQLEQIFENVAFIVFNYDRCLEHFLLLALTRLYDISPTDAAILLGKLTIIHPYGVIARLKDLPFGGGPARKRSLYGHPRYFQVGDDIHTYTEQAISRSCRIE